MRWCWVRMRSRPSFGFGSENFLEIVFSFSFSFTIAFVARQHIPGMPGTGKTTTIVFCLRALAALGKSVLLCAYTHSAVDTILLKLAAYDDLRGSVGRGSFEGDEGAGARASASNRGSAGASGGTSGSTNGASVHRAADAAFLRLASASNSSMSAVHEDVRPFVLARAAASHAAPKSTKPQPFSTGAAATGTPTESHRDHQTKSTNAPGLGAGASASANVSAMTYSTVAELRALATRAPIVATTCLGIGHPLLQQRAFGSLRFAPPPFSSSSSSNSGSGVSGGHPGNHFGGLSVSGASGGGSSGFDVCIVDEASQVTQPVCIGALRFANAFVLVGDHYQLPPLVASAECREGGMGVSLFRRLCEAHPQAVVALESQYRMAAPIMSLANELVYNQQLRCGSAAVAAQRLRLPALDATMAEAETGAAESRSRFISSTSTSLQSAGANSVDCGNGGVAVSASVALSPHASCRGTGSAVDAKRDAVATMKMAKKHSPRSRAAELVRLIGMPWQRRAPLTPSLLSSPLFDLLPTPWQTSDFEFGRRRQPTSSVLTSSTRRSQAGSDATLSSTAAVAVEWDEWAGCGWLAQALHPAANVLFLDTDALRAGDANSCGLSPPPPQPPTCPLVSPVTSSDDPALGTASTAASSSAPEISVSPHFIDSALRVAHSTQELHARSRLPVEALESRHSAASSSTSPMGAALVNATEAAVVCALVRGLLAAGVALNRIGVIAPYRAQHALLRTMLSSVCDGGGTGAAVEVLTIDKVQGRDMDVVIMSLVRSNFSVEHIAKIEARSKAVEQVARPQQSTTLISNLSCTENAQLAENADHMSEYIDNDHPNIISEDKGFDDIDEEDGSVRHVVGSLLREWRRVNVAITRARSKLLIVGSVATLRHAPPMRALLRLTAHEGWLRTLPPGAQWMYPQVQEAAALVGVDVHVPPIPRVAGLSRSLDMVTAGHQGVENRNDHLTDSTDSTSSAAAKRRKLSNASLQW
jgi:hypothetical protein